MSSEPLIVISAFPRDICTARRHLSTRRLDGFAASRLVRLHSCGNFHPSLRLALKLFSRRRPHPAPSASSRWRQEALWGLVDSPLQRRPMRGYIQKIKQLNRCGVRGVRSTSTSAPDMRWHLARAKGSAKAEGGKREYLCTMPSFPAQTQHSSRSCRNDALPRIYPAFHQSVCAFRDPCVSWAFEGGETYWALCLNLSDNT